MPISYRKNKRNYLPIIVVLILVGIASVIGVKSLSSHKASPKFNGNTTKDAPKGYSENTPTPSPSSSNAPSSSAASATETVLPTKPSLQKSSGNAPGSVVAAGSNIEFTCTSSVGATCAITLTDKNNPARAINLPEKNIMSNDRGAYFALWTWTAVAGQWSVTAKATNGAGSRVSDAQLLEVK